MSTSEPVADARPGFLDRSWVPPAFFVATIAATFLVGLENATNYYGMVAVEDPTIAQLLVQASIYMLALIAVLGTHELGHWLVARAHGVKTSLPVFIPMPFGLGTFGAIIAMRDLPSDRTTLLRIGAAGPLAGGVVALVLMAIAASTSPMMRLPEATNLDGGYVIYGNSLGTLLLAWLSPQEIPAGFDLIATPLFQAAWAGFLLTSMNLFPIGQLDGGHIAYAFVGERLNRVSRFLAVGVVGLSLLGLVGDVKGFSPSYIIWGLLLFFLVWWHPPIPAQPPLGRGSRLLALASFVLLVLTFMPSPMRFVLW